MEGEPKRVDVISFMAPINDSTISRLIDLTYNAHAEGSSEVRLLMSSIGGKLPAAFAAYHFFRSLHIPVSTHNVGSIESAALIMYLASDCRSASPGSKFMFYNFEWTFYRDHIRFPEVVEAYESMKYDAERYTEIFNERTNQTFDIMSCLTGPSRVLDPAAAVKAGIVTDPEIAAPILPELAKMWTVHN